MSPLPPEQITIHLRTITNVLISTLEDQLHNHVPLCINTIQSTSLLEDASAQISAGGRFAADLTTLLHKFKTRISSLLQSKSVQAKWSALCIIKAGVETSATFLQSVGVWIPFMLKMLTRPESPSVVERSIANLTRIFVLTSSKPALTRELTTPHLPQYIQHILSPNLTNSSHLFVILTSISEILKTHPTTFRPQQQKTSDLVRSILYSEDDKIPDERLIEIAAVVHVTLVRCAPPKSQSEEWVKLFKDTLVKAEQTCDILFDCLLEDKDRGKDSQRRQADRESGTKHLLSPERIGVQRLRRILLILYTFLNQHASSTPPPIVHISPLLALVSRLCSISPETRAHATASPSTYHLLMTAYPYILNVTICLVGPFLHRKITEYSPSSTLHLLRDVLFVASTASKANASLRMTCYSAISQILSASGTTIQSEEGKQLSPILSMACDDLIPPPPPVIITKEPVTTPGSMLLTQPTSTYKKRKAPTPQNKANTPSASTAHPDQFMSNATATTAETDVLYPGLAEQATELLVTAIRTIPAGIIGSEIRSKIERTLIISGSTDGVLAAVLYPSSSKKRGSSLLPHLVSLYDENQDEVASSTKLGIEGTLWPRMQVITPAMTMEEGIRSPSITSPVFEGNLFSSGALNGSDYLTAKGTFGSLNGINLESTDNTTSSTFSTNQAAGVVEDESYPSPPPAPVPQHAKLPSLPNSPSGMPAPPPPAPPSQPTRVGGGMNGLSDRSPMLMAMPSPGRVHAVLPPSPLRQSMSILEAEDVEGTERIAEQMAGRAGKRLKVDDEGKEKEENIKLDKGKGRAIEGDNTIIANTEGHLVPQASDVGQQDDSDGDGSIPEIHMGDSDDEDE